MKKLLQGRLFLSTIAEDAAELARERGLGLEVADFCTASNMDDSFPRWDKEVWKKIQGIHSLILHAPFNELFTAAIDPLVLEVTHRRYRQAIEIASRYGAKKVVFHSTFVPGMYFPAWFIPRSVEFWKRFLKEVPENICCCIENVMDIQPEPLLDIMMNVADPRLQLCLDIGHINVVRSQKTVEAWIKDMAPWISHVHVHNNHGDQDTHNQPWDGSVPMEEVLKCVLEEAPEATMTLETIRSKPSVMWMIERGFL